MSSEHFRLKWNNFEYNITAFLNALRNGDEFVDVTITCNSQSFKAHKLILSACSPYFHQIFQDNPCKHPVIILKNVSATEMESILMYIYTGEAYVTEDNISSFFATAQLLQIVGLTYGSEHHKKIETESKRIKEESIFTSDESCSHERDSVREKSSLSEPKKINNLEVKSNILKNRLNNKNENCNKKLLVKTNVGNVESKNKQKCNGSEHLHTKNTENENRENESEKSTEELTIEGENLTETEIAEKAALEETCPILSQQLLLPKKRKLSADYNKNTEYDSENNEENIKNIKLDDKICDTEPCGDSDSRSSCSDILRSRLSDASRVSNTDVDSVSVKKEPVEEDLEIESENDDTKNYLEPEIFVKEECPSVESDEDSTHGSGLGQWNHIDESSLGGSCQGNGYDRGNNSAINTILKVPNPDITLFSKTLKKVETNESESAHLSLTPNVEIFLKNATENSSDLLQNLGKTNLFQKSQNKAKNNKKYLMKQLSLLSNLDISRVDGSDKKSPSTSKEEISVVAVNKHLLKNKSEVKTIQKSEIQKVILKSDGKLCSKIDGNQKTLHSNFNLTNFPCPHCKQPYSNLSALKYHVRLMHSDLENMLYCYLCPMSFIEREYFKAHLWETHNARF